MSGLGSRLVDGECAVTEIKADFRSGLKYYSLTASPDKEGRLRFNFGGNSYDVDHDGFVSFVRGLVPGFDELTLVYSDPVKDSMIVAKDRDVVFRTAGREEARSGAGDAGAHGRALRTASMSNRAYFIKPEDPQAAEMLKAIGVMGENGKVKNDKIRKYNQIDHFIELIDPMLRKICAEKKDKAGKTVGDRSVSIVDCACGKSYLSFALYYYIKNVLKTPCRFTGLDYNATVIEDSAGIAGRIGYSDMKFIRTDISKYRSDERFDLLISLHACDTATDLALRFGLERGIKAIVCVPCCHKEMNAQGYSIGDADPVLKYGILKARIADSLTDGLRGLYLEASGYDVSMVEYISPLDTPKNLMMRCVRTREPDGALFEKYDKLCEALGVKLSISGDR